MKNILIKEVHELKEELIRHRRYLHAHAEVGFDLKQTYSYVYKQLSDMRYAVHDCGKCGLYVEAGHKEPIFLLRADMDALPIIDKTDLDFKSENNMHACGHDFHAAMMLGAAKILKKHENELKGTVRIMFQPAEEIFEGAKDMIDHGVIENVSAGLMMHVVSGSDLKTGSVMVSDGGVNAPAADIFTIEVNGKGCHGSTPQLGIDALNSAAHILIALQEISARELAGSDEVILTIGSLNAGEAPNAIANKAVMKGTLRTFDEDLRAHVKERMAEIIDYTSKAFRTESSLTFTSGTPSLKNDDKLSESVYKHTLEILGSDYCFTSSILNNDKPARLGGSEDFAYISRQIPIITLTLGCGNINDGYTYPLHHPCVLFDEEGLVNGCLAYVYNAMMWLKNQ